VPDRGGVVLDAARGFPRELRHQHVEVHVRTIVVDGELPVVGGLVEEALHQHLQRSRLPVGDADDFDERRHDANPGGDPWSGHED